MNSLNFITTIQTEKRSISAGKYSCFLAQNCSNKSNCALWFHSDTIEAEGAHNLNMVWARQGMGDKHGKHTEHVKFLITLMAELSFKQPFLNHATQPRVLMVSVTECKKMYFLGLFITLKLIHPMQLPTQELGMNIYCASEVLYCQHMDDPSIFRQGVLCLKWS